MASEQAQDQNEPMFDNPFQMTDLLVFDDETLHKIVVGESFGLTCTMLARSLHDAPEPLLRRIRRQLSPRQRLAFARELRRAISPHEIEEARRTVLNSLFWELTYWKTPDLYEQLTEGEYLHPGIFEQLAPYLRNATVLDAGAGSGRASFECLRYQARRVYAVEPSPGLLHLLQQKIALHSQLENISPLAGRFDALPLADNSVDIALSCSAFTALPEQGGEPGLAELRRVTRPGGKIVLIWPRSEDRTWLAEHGFHYVALPLQQEMRVHFRTLVSAIRCARLFYAHNRAVLRYILSKQKADVPFSVIGVNPPRDYCWLDVT